MPQRPIQAVLFDLDDTLLDWSARRDDGAVYHRPHLTRLYGYLAECGHDLPAEAVFLGAFDTAVTAAWAEAKKTWQGVNFANTLQTIFTNLGLDTASIDITAVLLAYDWQPIPDVSLYADAIPVLATLRQQNYRLGLITNSMMPMWMRDIELQAYGILDYFAARITSGDVGYMKPHPAIYTHTLSLLNVRPEQAVFVGDRPSNDIVGANAAGLTSVLMAPSHLGREQKELAAEARPDFVITTLTELLPLLDSLQGGSGKDG
ncbi:MAG: HAD-IA family hydrolase [Chloroflexi bacterium]|nr:HAD-IA family hydrolase [Chloroflexota bacterium]